MKCSYCGKAAHLVQTKWGWRWCCYKCDARVGCHRGTKKALGTLADKNLRYKRMLVHLKIDPFWQVERYTRTAVYESMSRFLGIDRKACHVGLFDEATCDKIIEAFKQ